MSMSKITVVNSPVTKPISRKLSDIPVGTAFTGSLMGLYNSPYTGVFLKQGRSLVAFLDSDLDYHKSGNVFFNTEEGTIEDFREVDLEIKAVPRV